MKIIEYRTQVKSRSDYLELIPIGDIHDGTKNCDEDKLQETVDYIAAEPYRRWLGIGDYGEFINYTDKRFDPSNLHPRYLEKLDNLPKAQADHLIEIFKPIKDKCIGLLEGNHDETIRQKYHLNIVDYMAGSLGTVNLSYTALIRWNISRVEGHGQNVVIYASHGFGSASSDGAALNSLMQQSKNFDADIYLMGHVHRKTCTDTDRLFVSQSGEPELRESKRLFGITGTFYRTYQVNSRSYGEKKGYSPTPTGCLKIRIEPFRATRKEGKQVCLPPHLHISA